MDEETEVVDEEEKYEESESLSLQQPQKLKIAIISYGKCNLGMIGTIQRKIGTLYIRK